MHSVIITSLLFTFPFGRKREVLSPSKQLNQPWCVLVHYSYKVIQHFVPPGGDVLVGTIDIVQ